MLHMQPMHTGEPVARSPDALARPASNNMPLSEHDTQELWRLWYLKAESIERQEWLQYVRQTWKSSIWSEEDDDSYTLPDPEIPLVYSLHYGQQCPPEWDDGSVPAKTADRRKKKEHGKSNLHAEEDFLQKLESLNLDPRLKKLLITYEEVFGALPPPLSCKEMGQMDLKLKAEFEETRVGRRPYPAPQEQVEEIERQIQECIDAPMILAAVFPKKFKKSTKRGFSREMTYVFGFHGPKSGGGVLLPERCPKISETLKFGLLWGIFACSGLVLQNSAAHQCTCL